MPFRKSRRPEGQTPAPGGAGWMLNPFYPPAMNDYLRRFTGAFARYDGPKPRAAVPGFLRIPIRLGAGFLCAVEKRRGYKLQTELPALLGTNRTTMPRASDPITGKRLRHHGGGNRTALD